MTFTFRHLTAKGWDALLDEAKGKDLTNVEFISRLVAGWSGVDEAYSDEALARLLDNYHGASIAIRDTYFRQMQGARAGN